MTEDDLVERPKASTNEVATIPTAHLRKARPRAKRPRQNPNQKKMMSQMRSLDASVGFMKRRKTILGP